MSQNLATVERITEITPHPNADRLEFAQVLGYRCIVPKGVYREGDLVVFVKPDSCLPDTDLFTAQRKWCGRNGRVRAIKLRGEWSMGLVLQMIEDVDGASLGDDMTTYLGITKHEPPLPNGIDAIGPLPYWLPKTDEPQWQTELERIQQRLGQPVTVSLKLDGTSATFFTTPWVLDGPIDPAYAGLDQTVQVPGGSKTIRIAAGVASRSLVLNAGPLSTNPYIKVERKYDILSKLLEYSARYKVFLAVRGEVTGAGIQSSANNPHSNGEVDFHVFSVFLMGSGYQGPHDPHGSINVAKELGLKHVPIIGENLGAPIELTMDLINLFDTKLSEFNGKPFEGVVLRFDDGFSFKVINKHYDAAK